MSELNAPPEVLWRPSQEFVDRSNLIHYLGWLRSEKGLYFQTYDEVWQWSVQNLADFWESIWQYFHIKSYTPYKQVLSADPMPDTRWFEGSSLNYAEHIFRRRTKRD